VQIDTSLVEALLAEQCPALEGLPLTPTTNGWDNAVYRLGDSLTVRLPRRAQAAPMLENEITWLPIIAPLLTLPVPQPVYAGHPGCSYPYSWMVAPWFDGTRAASAPLASRTAFASELADFLWTLHAPAPAHAPINPFRGMSLAQEGPDTRARARIARERERDGLLRRWESWVSAPDFDDVDMWLHGDLHPANLVMGHDGHLAAVIDWGDMTVGDPACDLATAWLTFDEEGRGIFRDRLDQGGATDAATWRRAQAWALHLGLLFAQDCSDDPDLQECGRRALEALLTEPV
jgi:aminoglycoside phosphotransferase (APT) family kinase protein